MSPRSCPVLPESQDKPRTLGAEPTHPLSGSALSPLTQWSTGIKRGTGVLVLGHV